MVMCFWAHGVQLGGLVHRDGVLPAIPPRRWRTGCDIGQLICVGLARGGEGVQEQGDPPRGSSLPLEVSGALDRLLGLEISR